MIKISFLDEWFENARNVVFSPSEFYREVDRHEGYVYPAQFAALSFLVAGVLTGLVDLVFPSTIAGSSGLTSILFGAIGGVVGGLIGLFIGAGLVHIFVYLFGGRGYQTTFEALAYSTAVTAFFGWIPFINFVAGLYALYVNIRGVEVFHDLSFGRAAASVLLPALILGIIGFALAALAVLTQLALGL